MDGLLTPVSTSYKSSEKPVEDALYVYPHLYVSPALRHPTCELPRHQILVLTCPFGHLLNLTP